MGKKVKGTLLVGMMVAIVGLTGCGNEIDLVTPQEFMAQNTKDKQVSNEKEYETYLFFDGISKEPKELQVTSIEKKGSHYAYITIDNYRYVFHSGDCMFYKYDGDEWTID